MACYQHEGRAGGYIADTHYNLGVALSGLGRIPEPGALPGRALRIVPGYTARAAASRLARIS